MTSNAADFKIRQLCETLEKEALEPAQKEAESLISNARVQAEDIVKKARADAEAELRASRAQLEQERKIFDSSLRQAAVLARQSLRNEFEEKLFRPNLAEILKLGLADPVTMTRLIRSLIDAIEREGLNCDLTVEVSKSIDIDTLNALLGQSVLKRLREGTCLLANISSGVRIGLQDRGLTIDFSDQFLIDLLQKNLQSTFAKTYFQNS